MNRFEQIHRCFATLNIATVLAGLAYGPAPITLNVILLTVLMILIRAKFWLDDEAYLEDVKAQKLPGGLPFSFGVFIAVISWIVWLFAALFIKNIELSSLLMLLVFLFSTFSIVAAMVSKGAYAEQVPWLFFNVLYGLSFFLLWARQATWNPFNSSPIVFATVVLLLLFGIFISDLTVTRILEQRRR